MEAYNPDIDFFPLRLRKHAAAYQTGMSLREAKLNVDSTLHLLKTSLGDDKEFQLKKWTELLSSLDSYLSKTSDPLWITVINYARLRVKSRRSTIINK